MRSFFTVDLSHLPFMSALFGYTAVSQRSVVWIESGWGEFGLLDIAWIIGPCIKARGFSHLCHVGTLLPLVSITVSKLA